MDISLAQQRQFGQNSPTLKEETGRAIHLKGSQENAEFANNVGCILVHKIKLKISEKVDFVKIRSVTVPANLLIQSMFFIFCILDEIVSVSSG